jgi:membrane associated rhomboid family serine protease
MWKKQKIKPDAATLLPLEEYRLFASQPVRVLQSYSLAKVSMVIALPLFAIIGVVHVGASLALSAVVGIAAFIVLRKRYGGKAALVPFFCSLIGTALGACLIPGVLTHIKAIKEAANGS